MISLMPLCRLPLALRRGHGAQNLSLRRFALEMPMQHAARVFTAVAGAARDFCDAQIKVDHQLLNFFGVHSHTRKIMVPDRTQAF